MAIMKTKKKIAVIGTVGLPANYGGFETLTEHLVKNLDKEYDITVYCSGRKYKKVKGYRQKHYRYARLKYLPFKANGAQSIIYDTLSIIHSLFYADVLLILGVPGAWILPFIRTFTNKKIIISIDGIEWKREKWNFFAKCYLFWAEKQAVKYSHIDISDNESIQDYTALRYGSLSRIIEYGADHTKVVVPVYEDRLEYPFLNKPYAFKVCRIEPENNVHTVLKSFAQLTKYMLVMVGNWNNSEYGSKLKSKFSNYSNIILLNPIYNQSKLDLLRSNALVYIHGHSAGGTNPSLVEAMYLGLPIIAYGVSYNRTTTEHKATYFKSKNGLKKIIKNSSIKEMKEQGSLMKSIASRRYTWSIVCAKYKELIVEVLTVKEKQKVKPKLAHLELSELLEMNLGHLKHQQLFFETP